MREWVSVYGVSGMVLAAPTSTTYKHNSQAQYESTDTSTQKSPNLVKGKG